MANVPAHGELFIGGVMDEKCRIIFCINLPSSNGGLLAYLYEEVHRYTVSLSISITHRIPHYFIFSSYSFSLSFTQEVAGDALNGHFFPKKGEELNLLFALNMKFHFLNV